MKIKPKTKRDFLLKMKGEVVKRNQDERKAKVESLLTIPNILTAILTFLFVHFSMLVYLVVTTSFIRSINDKSILPLLLLAGVVVTYVLGFYFLFRIAYPVFKPFAVGVDNWLIEKKKKSEARKYEKMVKKRKKQAFKN